MLCKLEVTLTGIMRQAHNEATVMNNEKVYNSEKDGVVVGTIYWRLEGGTERRFVHTWSAYASSRIGLINALVSQFVIRLDALYIPLSTVSFRVGDIRVGGVIVL